eukprot:GSMAST32.ASY1.ANO1.1411.1 assembled CDS
MNKARRKGSNKSNNIKKKNASNSWLQRHVNDPFVKHAQKYGFRSRAAFKLEEIAKKNGLLKQGQRVVDIGAAPGGWTQVCVERVGALSGKGRVVAVDLLHMENVQGATFIRGDATAADTQQEVLKTLGGFADVLISDMAPSLSGQKSVDMSRQMDLCGAALAAVDLMLRTGGVCIMKVFQSEELRELMQSEKLKDSFNAIKLVKPAASRSRSSEMFLVAKGFKRNK